MKHLRVMKEDYVYGHCVFMLHKASPYLSSINSIVHKVRETGLVLYWEDLTVRRYMSTRHQLAVINSRKEVDSCPTQLKLRHVTVSIYLFNKQTSILSNKIICLLQHSYMFWLLAI